MGNEEKTIVLLDCFARKEAEQALAAYAGGGSDPSGITVAPVTDLVAPMKTAAALDAVRNGAWPGGNVRTGRRGALIATDDKAVAVGLMRAFKSILPKDADPAFAMVTETGLGWTVGDYLSHIRKEHEYMKTSSPADDPDMKAMD